MLILINKVMKIGVSVSCLFFVFILIYNIFYLHGDNNNQVIEEQIIEIINSKPMTTNYKINDTAFYLPDNFKDISKENQILFSDGQIYISFYKGLNASVQKDLIENINREKQQVKNFSRKDKNQLIYMYMWDYETDSKTGDYLQVLFGINDNYITAVLPKEKQYYTLVIITEMYNSIQEIQ